MKILCLIDSLGSGGAQRQMVELAKGFKEKGHQVGFITYHEINFFKPELVKNEIWVETIVEPNYLKRLLKMRKVIRRQEPDAVLSFLEAANFISTLSGFPFRKWRLIVGERSANPNILKSKKLRMYRWFHLFADYVVANSYANLEMVEKINPFIRSRKMKVIYNIVNTPIIESVNTDTHKTNIVVAASYRSVKNTDGLIEAISLLSEEYKNKLNIEWYGNPDDREYYNSSIKAIDKYDLSSVIKLNLATTEIYEKYAQSDFVALFSHYEGFPNTICEAMSLSKPVIVSKASDIPIFIKEGVNGFLCDSKDVSSIKDALMRAIDSTQEKKLIIGKNNSEVAEKMFDRHIVIEDYLILLGK